MKMNIKIYKKAAICGFFYWGVLDNRCKSSFSCFYHWLALCGNET